MSFDLVKPKIENVLCSIKDNEQLILTCLQKTETNKTAKSEIEKCIFCLKNVDKQIEYLQNGNFSDLCVFLPMNQPLYSLVLFAIIPGCLFRCVVCRPPVLLSRVYADLFSILKLSDYSIVCEDISRREFIKQYASFANAIIYTGQYENAVEVMESTSPRTVFIFQGSGTNPIIITESALITDTLIDKVVDAQLYNSGQDCMAPSAILVSDNKWSEFTSKLIDKLCVQNVGDYKDPQADIAPMIEESNIGEVNRLFEDNKDCILFGGKIDCGQKTVLPTVIEFTSVYELPFRSSFSPTFCLYRYQQETEVVQYLLRPECQENKAYVSIFGDMVSPLGNEIVINNDVLDSVDNGYSEFGGYGIRSGFISYNSTITAKPILISRELAMYRNINGVAMPTGDLENPTYEASIVLSNIELSNKSILEIGCGTIPHAKILAPHCKSYIAIDTNQGKVNEATDDNTFSNLSIENMSGADLKFETQEFDVAFMFHCLHEVRIEEQGAIIKEIHRVLKNKGLLLIIDAISEQESNFQKCFDVVHERFFDYKHIYSVKHSEWIISEYIGRGYFREIKTETHKMVFPFSNIEELRDCLLHSFMHEYKWDDEATQKLTELITERFKNCASGLELEEIINIRILERTTVQGDNNEQ